MSESMICPEARRQALATFENLPDFATMAPALTGVLPRPNSDEALAMDSELKPLYYGILGHAIRYIIDNTVVTSIPKHTAVRDFQDLFDGSYGQMKNGLEDFENDDTQAGLRAYAEQLQAIRGYLRPVTYPSLKQSLRGGIGTAASASVMLLRDYAKALRHLNIEGDAIGAVRKSYGPLIENASCNSAQLFMLDELQKSNRMPAVVYSADNKTLRYEESPLDMPINDSMRARFEVMTGGRTPASTTREIKTITPVVGCPILLKPKQVQRFWNWTIDQAVARGLVS